MAVTLQREDFSSENEIKALTATRTDIGALVTFIGLVRDFSKDKKLNAMELEHYPDLAQKVLEDLEQQAIKRWNLQATRVIHRYGRLTPGEQIVLVITASPHRQDAFDAAQFLMDFLKSEAPFWKKEIDANDQGEWVDARESDLEAMHKWRE